MRSNKGEALVFLIMSILAVFILLFMFWAFPQYAIWQQEMSGRAQLAEAEFSKKVSIEEAKAKLDSAQYESKAEIERAKGVAEANKIIGDSLRGNESYLRYLWIQNLNSGSGERIYIPTEAGLPILEAGK